MKIIVHNDDFGLTYGFNSAIKNSSSKGISSSTSLRVNGTAFGEALALAKKDLRGMGIGIHLNLTDGPTLLPGLAEGSGKYRYNFVQYLYLLNSSQAAYFKKIITEELTAQIETVISQQISVDHLDSQDHIHMIPPIFEIVARLAKKYAIPGIRIVREPNYSVRTSPVNLIKHTILNSFGIQNIQTANKYKLKYTDAFYGVLHTNNMSARALKLCLQDALARGFDRVEILSHPADIKDPRDLVYTSSFIKEYANLKNRALEAEALTSKQVKNFILKKKIDIINYNDL